MISPDLKPSLALIVAMDKNRLIGRDGDLPWRLPNDLAHFKRTTMGKPILMGRKTWDSLGRPLPGRQNIVLTRDELFSAEGADVAHDLDAALTLAAEQEQVMMIGGAQLYELALPLAKVLYVTHVDAALEGDTWFPKINWDEWEQVSREAHPADEKNEYPHEFSHYIRRD